MTKKELILEIQKLKLEANKRADKFDKEDDYFLREKRRLQTYTNAKTSTKFRTGSLTQLNKSDLEHVRVILQGVVDNPMSTKQGRNERYNRQRQTFLENHPDFTPGRYDRWINFLNSDVGRAISDETKREYLCSEHEVQFMVDLHYNYRQIESAIQKAIPLCNRLGVGVHESCNIIKMKLEGKSDDEIMEVFNYSESWD